MIKYGVAPYIECSSYTETRFSERHARPASLNGRCIQYAYQLMKVYEDGSTNLGWYKSEGLYCVNREECAIAYEMWWREWIRQEDLLPTLRAATGISDRFAKMGQVCQSTVLWKIRNDTNE